MHESTIIQRALITVYDKTNIVPLAEQLHQRGVEILSTGNTAKLLQTHGLPVIPVSDYTGSPEIMGGRVKTLHPKIHGGILGRRDIDAEVMITNQIPDIDLVVVNLYPFAEVIKDPSHTLSDAIENIDIGGPTLLRAAAKNNAWCTVLVDPSDYRVFLDEYEAQKGAISDKLRFYLAKKAFTHTANYDATVTNYLNHLDTKEDAAHFEPQLNPHFRLKTKLRYGENPHQQAAFYETMDPAPHSIAQAKTLQGKTLSYNNIIDADTALTSVQQFSQSACVIVKHANPCGVALAKDAMTAYQKAYACDPTSAFGGIIAFNQTVDQTLMDTILKQQFVEIIIAPQFTETALQSAKAKPNCRLIQYQAKAHKSTLPQYELRSVQGGLLVQTWDDGDSANLEVVTKLSPSPEAMQDLLFSWQVAKMVKSNAIVFAKDGCTLGIGAGQMSRIVSTEIAASQAQKQAFDLTGAVMASDAFFPFQDNVEKAHALGIKAIIQPGGSIRDQDVIQCANDLKIAMVFTHMRHFRH